MWWATGAAAGLSAIAAAIWVRPSPDRLLRRRALGRGGEALSRSVWWRRDTGRTVRLAGAGVVGTAAWLTLQGRANLVVLAFVAVFVGWSVLTLRTRSRSSSLRRRRQAEMIELCDVLAAEVDAGASPSRALGHAARDWPLLGPAATASRLGGDVPRALRTAARVPGCDALRQLGAAWEVSVRSGAALAATLDRMSRTLRDDQEARREVTASLGSPRATARLLAVLPLFGLALGGGMGGEPWVVLTGSMFGAICLAIGAALAACGVFWVERIADRAEIGS